MANRDRSEIENGESRRERLNSWKYERTAGTEIEYPISNSPNTSGRPEAEWTSSDFVREICYELTGTHTFHAQDNLEIIRHFINEHIHDQNKIFRRSAWQLGNLIFESYEGIFRYDFQKKANPNLRTFLLELLRFQCG
jgi:hypothetical protein